MKACCILHNFLRDSADYHDRSTLQVNEDGDVLMPVGGAIVNVAYMHEYHSVKDALQTRELLKPISTALLDHSIGS